MTFKRLALRNKKSRLTEGSEDGTLFSSSNLTIKREGGVLKFDFSMPGWWHDSEDPAESAGIIKGSKYKSEPEVQQIVLTDTDKSNMNVSEFLYWLSGGNRSWSPGGDNDFNVGWEEVEPVLTEKFGNKYSQILKACTTLGEVIKVYEDEKEDFIYDFYDLASEQGWSDDYEEGDENPQENNRIKIMKRPSLAESKKKAVQNKITKILKSIIKEEYGKMLREEERMSDAVRELTLFADNDHKLYNDLMNNYLKNMVVKKKRGVYDHNLAIKLLEYYYQNYVRPAYKREFGDDVKLSPQERKEFAEYYVNALEQEDDFVNAQPKQVKP
jgi:hypothetical protein